MPVSATPPAAKAAARTTIAVQGARVHNLKNVSLELPRDRLIVVTGGAESHQPSIRIEVIRVLHDLSGVLEIFISLQHRRARFIHVRAQLLGLEAP